MEPNRIICTHRPSHCHSARILIWSTPNVSIYEIFHGQVPLVVKEVQFTLWGIPAENRADEFAKFMSADFYSYALTLLYVSMLLHHVCKGRHFYAIYQTFLEIFSAFKKLVFASFLQTYYPLLNYESIIDYTSIRAHDDIILTATKLQN